jgi:hypothetical protein
VVGTPPAPLHEVRRAALSDLSGPEDHDPEVRVMQVQNLLRHALADTISENVVNCLIITNSSEANVQLTRIHEHLFARKLLHSLKEKNLTCASGDPTVACVWRRQTFSAAVDNCSPEMSNSIIRDHLPGLFELLANPDQTVPASLTSILDNAYSFSRMLHGTKSGSGGTLDAFYRAFVPELGSILDPRQMELIKRCVKSERGEQDRVGACIFPGLVKVTGAQTPIGLPPTPAETTTVKRALVICDCAMGLGGPPPLPAASMAPSMMSATPQPSMMSFPSSATPNSGYDPRSTVYSGISNGDGSVYGHPSAMAPGAPQTFSPPPQAYDPSTQTFNPPQTYAPAPQTFSPPPQTYTPAPQTYSPPTQSYTPAPPQGYEQSYTPAPPQPLGQSWGQAQGGAPGYAPPQPYQNTYGSSG